MHESAPIGYFIATKQTKLTMGKSTHFIGQPLYSQVINLLDKSKNLQLSRKYGGERYIKSFNCWSRLVVMLYAVIMRFDSLCEISASMLGEARKLNHLGIISMHPRHHKYPKSNLLLNYSNYSN